MFLVASCYRNRDNLRPGVPLDLTLMSYRDGPSCETNRRGQLVKTDDSSACSYLYTDGLSATVRSLPKLVSDG